VLLGTKEAERRAFGSCCHGAGRVLSRNKARERARGRDIARELAKQGISLQAAGRATVEEELSRRTRTSPTWSTSSRVPGWRVPWRS
jgi:tRNA-splicing ligase RtcB